jgi:hypothetical protein
MTTIITHDSITTLSGGQVVYVQTRDDVLAELRAYRANNNFKLAGIYSYKLSQMNAAK